MKAKELISDNEYVRYKRCGNQLVMYVPSVFSRGGNITKVSAKVYLVNSTNELRTYRISEKNYKDKQLLNKSLNELYFLLLENTTDTHRCVGITLTYADNMRDFTKANKQFNRFIEKLRDKHGKMEYISVVELQKRGVIHFHLVCIYSQMVPCLDYKEMNRIWKHGNCYVESVKSSNQVARYFTKYNLDLKESVARELFPNDIDNYLSYINLDENGKTESFVEGIAIQLLPRSLHIYRHSNGIIIPETKEGIKSSVITAEIESGTLEYSYTSKKVDDFTGDSNQKSIREFFNRIT